MKTVKDFSSSSRTRILCNFLKWNICMRKNHWQFWPSSGRRWKSVWVRPGVSRLGGSGPGQEQFARRGWLMSVQSTGRRVGQERIDRHLASPTGHQPQTDFSVRRVNNSMQPKIRSEAQLSAFTLFVEGNDIEMPFTAAWFAVMVVMKTYATRQQYFTQILS